MFAIARPNCTAKFELSGSDVGRDRRESLPFSVEDQSGAGHLTNGLLGRGREMSVIRHREAWGKHPWVNTPSSFGLPPSSVMNPDCIVIHLHNSRPAFGRTRNRQADFFRHLWPRFRTTTAASPRRPQTRLTVPASRTGARRLLGGSPLTNCRTRLTDYPRRNEVHEYETGSETRIE